MAPTISSFINTFSVRLERPIVSHLKSVYACLSFSCLAASAGSALALMDSHPLQFLTTGILPFLLSCGSLIAFLMTPHDPVNRKNQSTRLALLMALCFFTGVSLGPLLEVVMFINPSIVVTALVGTAVIFACFSASALYAQRGYFLFLGGILSSALSFLLLLTLGNMFFRSHLVFQLNLWIGFAVMCAFVLLDTQLIVEKRRGGDTDFIAHSMDLFVDLIGIFRRLLIILAQKEEQQNKRKRND